MSTRSNLTTRRRDAFELMRTKLEQQQESPSKVLDDIERYQAWFIPIITSIYFLFIGLVFRSGLPVFIVQDRAALAGFSMLFLSLVVGLLSRLFIFQFTRRTDVLVAGMLAFQLKLVRAMEGGAELVVKLTDGDLDRLSALPDEAFEGKEIEEVADDFFGAIRRDFPNLVKKGLARKLDAMDDRHAKQELFERHVQKVSAVLELRQGWGKWAIWAFYLSNLFFVASLAAWFVVTVRMFLMPPGA